MKPNLYVSFGWGLSSKQRGYNEMILHAEWLKTQKDKYNIVLLGVNRKESYWKKWQKEMADIFDCYHYVDTGDIKFENWPDYIEQVTARMGRKLRNPQDVLFEIFSFMNSQYTYDTTKKLNNLLTTHPEMHKNWLSTRGQVERLFKTMAFANANQLPVAHIIYDPNEVNWKECDVFKGECTRLFFYGSKRFDAINFDHINYYFQNLKVEPVKKLYNFAVSYTVLTPDRKMMWQYEDELNGLPESIVLKEDKYKKVREFIPKPQYLELLNDSYYTLVLPSYQRESFSYVRFIEAIAHNCIPLIMPECDLTECFGDDELIKSLITEPKDIFQKMVDWESSGLRLITLAALKSKFLNRSLDLDWERHL